jgi:hypothetical protein
VKPLHLNINHFRQAALRGNICSQAEKILNAGRFSLRGTASLLGLSSTTLWQWLLTWRTGDRSPAAFLPTLSNETRARLVEEIFDLLTPQASGIGHALGEAASTRWLLLDAARPAGRRVARGVHRRGGKVSGLVPKKGRTALPAGGIGSRKRLVSDARRQKVGEIQNPARVGSEAPLREGFAS